MATKIVTRLRSMFDLDGPNQSAKHMSNGSQNESQEHVSDKGIGGGVVLKDVNDEPEADRVIEPGELTFEEDARGGMGRHLGLFSTTLLMYAVLLCTFCHEISF